MLRRWWHEYLTRSGHYLHSTKNLHLSQSRDGKKYRYRWLYFTSRCPVRYLSKDEIDLVRDHLERAKRYAETLFLVVGFTAGPERVVILPADNVLVTGYVRADIGGIDWDE